MTDRPDAIVSMTGFARIDGSVPLPEGRFDWVLEVRSVNGKGLDLRCRLPGGYDRLEPAARAAAQSRIKRGSLSLSFSYSRGGGAQQMQINRDLLDRLLALAKEYGEPQPRLDALLAVRGVVEPVEGDGGAEKETVAPALDAALPELFARLDAARREEGARIAAVLTDQLDRMAALTAEAAAHPATGTEALKARLRAQLALLLDSADGLPEDKLAQEAALLAVKLDVREEIDRLTAHIAQARDLLAAGGAVGRRLDFLCQEFNREANTLCSKAADLAVTRIGLELKTVIDQFREQIQNIE